MAKLHEWTEYVRKNTLIYWSVTSESPQTPERADGNNRLICTIMISLSPRENKCSNTIISVQIFSLLLPNKMPT